MNCLFKCGHMWKKDAAYQEIHVFGLRTWKNHVNLDHCVTEREMTAEQVAVSLIF